MFTCKVSVPSLFIANPNGRIVLSRSCEVGSPTNPPWAPGSDKTRGQGSFGPFTGGLNLIKRLLQTI